MRSSRLLDAVTAIVVLELNGLRADGGSAQAVTRIPGVGHIVQRVAEVVNGNEIATRVIVVGRLTGALRAENFRVGAGAEHVVEAVVNLMGRRGV